MKKKYLTIAAILVLILGLAFNFYSQAQKNAEMAENLSQLLPSGAASETIAPNTVKFTQNGTALGYAGLAKYNGFGGPMLVGVITDTEGILQEVKILEHRETPQYLERIKNEGYFKQYDHRDIKQGTAFGVDIDGITSATLSTRAIAMCVDQVAEAIRVDGLGLPAHSASIPWQFGVAEIAAAVLLALLMTMIFVPKLHKFRPVLLILSVVVIGFWLNRPVTMAQISGMFMGYFPIFKTNLIWYLLLAAALLPVLLTGKNYYCTYFCPFGACQEGIGFVAKKINLPLSGKASFLNKTRNLLVFIALLVCFLFQNPSVGSYEPFATLFSQKGTVIQWLLLAAVLLAALFFKRFWCRGFCPVGGFLDWLGIARRKITKKAAAEPLTPNKEPMANKAETALPNQKLSRQAKMAESLFKLFYAVIIFSVVAAFFERWSLM